MSALGSRPRSRPVRDPGAALRRLRRQVEVDTRSGEYTPDRRLSGPVAVGRWGILPGTRHEARDAFCRCSTRPSPKRSSPAPSSTSFRFDPTISFAISSRESKLRLEIDGLISRHSIGWTVDRMPSVDRALLRMATSPALIAAGRADGGGDLRSGRPGGGVLDRRVGRFVNGVLAAIADNVRPEG